MSDEQDMSSQDANRKLPDAWRRATLGEVCEINPPRPTLERDPNAPTTFVPMSAVSEAGRGISNPEVRKFCEVRKGYTYLEEGDVLFAKITPCMQNGKHAIARNLLDRFGFASTEFHVLRPKHDILPSWVHHFLLQPWVLRDAVTSFTGAAGQQRVPEAFLAGLEIPLAPLAEQKRIVAILNEQMAAVERARAATEAQLDAAKALPPAYLRAVFNSPEAKKWPVRPLGEVSTIVTGSTPPRAHTPFYGGTIPWVKPDDLDRATYVSSSAEYLTDEGSQVARLLPPGSVLVSCIGKLGKCAVAGRTLSTNQQINSLIPAADVDSLYLYCVCRDLGRQMASAASTALIPILNKSTFSRIVAPFPPFPEQQRIAAMLSEQMASADLLRKQLEEQLDTINRLPAALLRRAFNGSL